MTATLINARAGLAMANANGNGPCSASGSECGMFRLLLAFSVCTHSHETVSTSGEQAHVHCSTMSILVKNSSAAYFRSLCAELHSFTQVELPEYFAEWERLGKNVAALLESHQLRNEVRNVRYYNDDGLRSVGAS